MKQCFVRKKFVGSSKEMIGQANTIIAEYQAQGFTLTLRQLYYQFVSRDLLPNTLKNYKRLGSIINDARLAGLIDWDAIEDRTRNLSRLATWDSPGQIVQACAEQYRVDYWKDQSTYVEVWIEKEALAGVFERVCHEYRLPFLCCRGYTSQSEMYGASRRLLAESQRRNGRNSACHTVTILHFGDHDPSGIDMTRDIRDRLAVFGVDVDLRRMALNFDQVEQYDPPPNPAKVTDSRYAEYEALHGDESWELDALEPAVLSKLVEDELNGLIDFDVWGSSQRLEQAGRAKLATVAKKL